MERDDRRLEESADLVERELAWAWPALGLNPGSTSSWLYDLNKLPLTLHIEFWRGLIKEHKALKNKVQNTGYFHCFIGIKCYGETIG